MRICDLTTLYLDGGQGGVNTYLLEKARYLSTRPEASHVIIVPGRRDERRTLFNSTVYTVKSPRLPSNPEHRVLTRFGEVQRILRDEDPEVVEVDCAYFLGKVAASVLTARNVPIFGFYHVHLPTFIARPSAARFSGRLASAAEHWAWRYVDYCYRQCDQLIVSSRDMYSRLQARGLSRLELLPLGVNLDLFRPADRAARSPGNPTTILSVGRLSREKELGVLVDAFRLLAARGQYRLVVVGDGPERRRLERQVGQDPRVTFLGSRPYGAELARIYGEADVLAVPSPNETFNLTLLEGLAAGLPVVAANQGGPVDLVAPGVGELARPSDAEDFAAKIERIALAPERYQGGREHVAARYSWRRTFDRLLEVYEEACVSRATRAGIASA